MSHAVAVECGETFDPILIKYAAQDWQIAICVKRHSRMWHSSMWHSSRAFRGRKGCITLVRELLSHAVAVEGGCDATPLAADSCREIGPHRRGTYSAAAAAAVTCHRTSRRVSGTAQASRIPQRLPREMRAECIRGLKQNGLRHCGQTLWVLGQV